MFHKIVEITKVLMMFIADKNFEDIDFSKNSLDKGDYENCIFQNCNFSDSDLSDFNFTECEFIKCNLSLAKLLNTVLNEVSFRECKMLGLNFNTINAFGLSLEFMNCSLNHSSFYKVSQKNTLFKNCQLTEVDFAETDLESASFDNCNFSGAMFDGSNLEKSDFRTSFNFSIDPENNRIKGAKFSIQNLVGLLGKYGIEVED